MKKKSSKRLHPFSVLWDYPDLESLMADVDEILSEPDKEVARLLFQAALYRHQALSLKRTKAGGVA